jgi:hypothetical protein
MLERIDGSVLDRYGRSVNKVVAGGIELSKQSCLSGSRS